MAKNKTNRKRRLPPSIVTDIEKPLAVRLARQLVIEWIEGALGGCLEDESYDFAYLRELLHLARTREGVAENPERTIVDGESLGVTVCLLMHLPETSIRAFETIPVGLPGGAHKSRLVQ